MNYPEDVLPASLRLGQGLRVKAVLYKVLLAVVYHRPKLHLEVAERLQWPHKHLKTTNSGQQVVMTVVIAMRSYTILLTYLSSLSPVGHDKATTMFHHKVLSLAEA